jgi:hypothetical protein
MFTLAALTWRKAAMRVANYDVALRSAAPTRRRRFLAWLVESLDSFGAAHGRNYVLGRDVRRAQREMDRLARLLRTDNGQPIGGAAKKGQFAPRQRAV